jgi:hypothetical protein
MESLHRSSAVQLLYQHIYQNVVQLGGRFGKKKFLMQVLFSQSLFRFLPCVQFSFADMWNTARFRSFILHVLCTAGSSRET